MRSGARTSSSSATRPTRSNRCVRRGIVRARSKIYEENPELKTALDQIRLGHFSPEEPHRFYDIFHTLVDWGDHYMVLTNFDSLDKTQTEVDLKYRDKDVWTASAIENVAGMGIFSSDRTITEYARDIWHVDPLQIT